MSGWDTDWNSSFLSANTTREVGSALTQFSICNRAMQQKYSVNHLDYFKFPYSHIFLERKKRRGRNR